ncbi:MAG: DNA polymerase I [Peptococcaceae bacterium]|jgi:DNA polymerase-1|nr:DNA polymerase I [Peptococcaceae bacterium]
MDKFLLVDGSSLLHRAFYALPVLTTQGGEYTNAVYGFIMMLNKVISQEQPDYLCVTFDKSRHTFRTEKYADYKGTRKETPSELKPQFQLVKEVLDALSIHWEELDGYEGDDILGTLAAWGKTENMVNHILTGDRDLLQLINGHTTVYLTKKGITDIRAYDEAALLEQYALSPAQIIDMKALMGDSSDNIPGVAGIGEKTATKLLHEFGDLNSIYERIDEVKPEKLKEKLVTGKEVAYLSRELATILCEVPMEKSRDLFAFRQPDYEKLVSLYQRLEFHSLLKALQEKVKDSEDVFAASQEQSWSFPYREIFTVKEIQAAAERIKAAGAMSLTLLLQGRALAGDVLAVGIGWENEAVGFVVNGWLEKEKLIALGEILADETIRKYVVDGKEAYVALAQNGISLKGVTEDVALAAYLLNPTTGKYAIGEIAGQYVGMIKDEENLALKAAQGCGLIATLVPTLQGKLEQDQMLALYREIELPLSMILAQMELNGVKVDKEQLVDFSQKLSKEIDILAKDIYQLAGKEFNINSPKQLQEILFQDLGLTPIKKTKTGFSTDGEVLEQLIEAHPIIEKILDYRAYAKLNSTYAIGLQEAVSPVSGYLHTSFNQMVTATGRLSSTEPNLQNIPIRMEMGRQIRKVFIPKQEGNLLLAADYSQIELRVLAHISEDPVLCKSFLEGEDIHARTAAEVFEIPLEQVDAAMRRKAKAVNFGIIYGISDFGLARDLGIGRKEAKLYIEKYFQRYEKISAYFENIVEQGKADGFVSTILGRRRYLPELASKNFTVRNFGKRLAMNSPIQGSAADIIKKAMILTAQAMKENQLQSQMILQVHDELIFDMAAEEQHILIPLVKECMEQAVSLKVPLIADMKMGPNWYDMKKL